MDSSSSGSGRDAQDSQEGDLEPVSRPAPLKLTEEEKAVLLECRRNSIARGLPLGVASVVALRWFVAQGRVPHHVQRWSWFYYSGAFLGSFLIGVSSYRQTCFEKLMALENSVLADQVRKHVDQIRTQGFDSYQECGKETAKSPSPHQPPYHSSPYQRQQEQRTYPPPGQYRHSPLRSPASESDKPSSLIADTYKQDKAALEAKEESVQQPDAFESFAYSSGQDHGVDNLQGDKHSTTPTKPRGRTFDEIREENRRRQLQQNYPRTPSSSGSGNAGGQRPPAGVEERDWRQPSNQERQQGGIKRRNKYGDEIYEEKSR